MVVASRKRLVIKIGTAALGAADGMPDQRRLGALVNQMAELKQAGHHVLLVSSGAVGTGRAMLKQTQHPLHSTDTVVERQMLASLGQAKLMALYQELLEPHGMMAAQVLLTKQDFRTRGHYRTLLNLFAAFEAESHILPIINENDSVTIDELMFTDNDELAGLLAAMMNADRLIILSHIKGVYDRPPDEEGARVISIINGQSRQGIPESTRGKSQSGRGGMSSKLGIARRMAGLGIQTHIADAKESNIIQRILADDNVGTTVLPIPHRRNATKRWLAGDVGSKTALHSAKVTANAELVAVLGDPHRVVSILPIGLVSVWGDFSKGDLVSVIDGEGEPVAIGVARYDASTLRDRLGQKDHPAFIHYDQIHFLRREAL